MGAYGTNAGMDDLLIAMRDGVKQETTFLQYLQHIAITTEWIGPIGETPAIYLVPTGSPEEEVPGAKAGSHAFQAVHEVDVICVHYSPTPYLEELIVGEGPKIGIVPLVSDVLDYFGGNTLSLSGLLANMPPTIQAPSGAYQVFQDDTEGNNFLILAKLEYKATTQPYTRP